MNRRCGVLAPAVPAPSREPGVECPGGPVSAYSFVWPSLVRGQALNHRRDPLDDELVRLPDERPWIGAAQCQGRGHRRRASPHP